MTRSPCVRRVPDLIRALCLLVSVLGLGCGSGTSAASAPSPAPSPTPAPTPGAPGPINLAGTWAGTLQAPGVPARTVAMLIVQSVDCVDGAWHTDPAEYTGAISGYASQTSFAGSLSLQRPADGQGKCGVVGNTDGILSGGTLTFAVSALTGECAAGGVPPSLTITLRRQ